MASTFRKGDVVALNTVVPSGPVLSVRMDDEGDVHYLIRWTDVDGVEQERWFVETTLVLAGS